MRAIVRTLKSLAWEDELRSEMIWYAELLGVNIRVFQLERGWAYQHAHKGSLGEWWIPVLVDQTIPALITRKYPNPELADRAWRQLKEDPERYVAVELLT